MGTRRIRRKDGDYTLFFRKVSPFSNHHPAEFVSDGAINCHKMLTFSCTEQFYMFNKASLMMDKQLMLDVLASDAPRAMKSMCSKGAIAGWSDARWDTHKEHVMYTACSAKFRASRHLRFVLFLSTGSRLVECSPFDSTWGIGKDIETAISSPVLSSGKNLLGVILDRVREELWADPDYHDEKEEIERRVEKDQDYLLTAMEHVDLIYKERARQRWGMSKGRLVGNEDYLTPRVRELLPEWAFPPPLGNAERIRPSPPQIVHFERFDPPHRARSVSPVCNPERSRLLKRLIVSEMRPAMKRVAPRSSSRSTYHVSRSRSRERKRRRSRSRSRSRSRRSRSRSKNRDRKRKRKSRSRSRSRTRRHRSRSKKRSRRSSSSRERKKSRKSEDREHKKHKKRHRSGSRHRHKKHKHHKSHKSRRHRSRSRSRTVRTSSSSPTPHRDIVIRI